MMGKNVDYKQFEQFAKRLEKELSDNSRQQFMEDCAKELAARLLSKVIKRTPVDEGNLRRSWTASSGMNVEKNGDNYQITIENTSSYASYVEYGSRTPGGKGWRDGQFFLTISEQEVEKLAPALLEKRLMEYLKGVFDG